MADSLWDQVKDFAYRHAPEAVRDRIDGNRAIARIEASMAGSAANGDTVAAQWLSKEPMSDPVESPAWVQEQRDAITYRSTHNDWTERQANLNPQEREVRFDDELEAKIEKQLNTRIPDDVVRHIDRQYAREESERPSTGPWPGWSPVADKQEPGQTEDRRQTGLWEQTAEVGRQTRQEAPQQESPQEKELQKRQLSM